MKDGNCKKCGKGFAYDEESGLNVKYFEGESTRTHFRAGGVFPCCPNCDERFTPPQTIFGLGDMKITTGFVMVDRKRLE